ncbi:MAG: antitoxin component YwqK of YwqJK toxin-antitoxin module [Maribacter sp.]|jgi:antitoxin component YwqK of YwqJK toxin-antitoxin module
MKRITYCTILLAFISTIVYCQTSEIIQLSEKNSYEYKDYYEDGSIKFSIGFYSKKPYDSVKLFEEELKNYKVKYHGEEKEYYPNGQLKEIVVYKKGKVIQSMKNYFEDGEEYAIFTDKMPKFQFDLQKQNAWLNQKIKEIENKYKVDLQGKGIIALDIGKDRTIKSIKVRTADKAHEKYLMEIGEQIVVKKSAMKNGKNIGTRFAFKMEFKKVRDSSSMANLRLQN